MTIDAERARKRPPGVNLSRMEALGDAIFAFSLTLLALDLRLPEIEPSNLPLGVVALFPKLLVFVFAFLVIAQEWDVHQRTMVHVASADGVFLWLYLLSLMFVVLMPASADVLGRFPLQPISLMIFGINIGLFCVISWLMWRYAARRGRLLSADIAPYAIRVVDRLWLFPPIVIAVTIPLGLLSVYPVYAIWFLMPVFSYAYSARVFRKRRTTDC